MDECFVCSKREAVYQRFHERYLCDECKLILDKVADLKNREYLRVYPGGGSLDGEFSACELHRIADVMDELEKRRLALASVAENAQS